MDRNTNQSVNQLKNMSANRETAKVSGRILVVGSMNMDLFVKGVTRDAKIGESLPCGSYGYAAGGKGANQALAVAKLGARVTMVGRVGTDVNGERLLEALQGAGVETQYIVKGEQSTGLAILLVRDDGRYTCYTVPGANDEICEKDVRNALDGGAYDMVVMQLEMPRETVYRTYELAKERGIPVFLDAGPATGLPLQRLKGLFILSPNEAEAEVMTGICPDTTEHAVEAAKKLYTEAQPEYVLLKLGERGALLYDGKEAVLYPAFRVEAVDSTAAGDTFGAALAIRLCEGAGMEEGIRFAHAAAGICVSRVGAQTSIPNREEVEAFLKEYV